MSDLRHTQTVVDIQNDPRQPSPLSRVVSRSDGVSPNSDSLKSERYREVLTQAEGVTSGEGDTVACMANVAALLHEAFGFWWTGFYRVANSELLLGPFQGPVACIHIAYGRGVCGTAWKERRTVVVPDVEQFPGHIACSALSRSEIVVPIVREGEITAVLDIDSRELSTFDDTDAHWLERIVDLIP